MEDKNRLEQGFDDPERQVIHASRPVTEIGKCIDSIERQAFEAATEEKLVEAEQKSEDSEMVPMGTASLKDIITNNVPAPTEEEVTVARAAIAGDVVARAKQKLEKELRDAKDKDFADPVIKHLLERIEESESLAADICQEHKTWNKCFDYIYGQAKKQAKNARSTAVRDDVVYEWAEDYFRLDDKAEQEKKAKEAAERAKKHKENEKKQREEQKKRIERMKKREAAKAGNDAKDSTPDAPQEKTETSKTKTEPKPKKNNKDMDGQMDLFSMMGL